MDTARKYGIFTWFGFLLPFEERLRLIKAAGFDCVCTWWDDSFSETDGDITEHPEKIEKAGLYLENVHLPYYGCNDLWHDTQSGTALAEKYCELIKLAGRCGIDTAVIHPTEVPHDYENGKFSAYLEHMKLIVAAAADAGVRLAVENLHETSTCRKTLEAFADAPHVGICFDTGHVNIVAPRDYSLITEHADRLFAIHLHDNHGEADEHILPYEGVIDWKRFMTTLDAADFGGALMLESSYPFDWTAAESGNYEYKAPPVAPEAYLDEAIKSVRRLAAETACVPDCGR